MKFLHLESVITALSPIHHSSFDANENKVTLRRIKTYTRDGLKEVPYIEGNSIRGRMRRLVMRDFVTRVGYDASTPRFYHLLFSGGKLEKVKSNEKSLVNLQMRRLVSQLMPPISIFGTSWLNQTIGGFKMKVGKAMPICKELDGLYFNSSDYWNLEDYNLKEVPSFNDLTTETAIYHWDELKVPREKDEDPYQMFIEKECFIAGTHFAHEFYFNDLTQVEEAFVSNMFDVFSKNPFLGANSGAGFGKVKLKFFGEDFKNLEPSSTYHDFIEENRSQIIEIFEILDRSLDAKSIKISAQDSPSHKNYKGSGVD